MSELGWADHEEIVNALQARLDITLKDARRVEARLTEAERLLRAVVDSCVNGPLSTDARALASWWEGFDDFVAFEVMTFLTASPEATS